MMMSTISRPLLINTQATTPHTFLPRHPQLRRANYRYRDSSSSFQVKMSSSKTVEHLVLFNVKHSAKPTQVDAMVEGLNGLRSLDMVLHLTSGPLLRNSSPLLNFTHMLHSRYETKEDLANYLAHNAHLSVVRSSVLPICDDIMMVDWVVENLHGPVEIKPGSALRVKLVKLKEGLGDNEKGRVIQVFGGLKEKVEGVEQLSFGQIFSVERAKGFSLASLGVFAGLKALDHVDDVGDSVEISKQKEEVRSFANNLVIVDYVVPSN